MGLATPDPKREAPPHGMIDLLAWAQAQEIKAAVVTQTPRDKPDPLPCLMALGRLGAKAEAASAFEDSRSGVQVPAAGVETHGMTTGPDVATLRSVGAAGARVQRA